MTATVAERLRDGLAALSPQERRVARALLANYPHAGLRASSELAEVSGVSAPTVVRFARAVGFAGYRDMQQALLTELSDRQASPVTRYEEARADRDGSTHWMEHGRITAADAINSSLGHIPQAELDAAVQMLANPKMQITAQGGRYSNFVAQYFALHLQQIRRNVSCRSEALTVGLSATIDAGKHDVYVLYDVRRYQRSTVELAHALADRGAHLIVITDPWLSPAANVADVVLPTSVRSSSTFDSLAPAFVLSELLIGAVLDACGEEGVRRIKQWDDASHYEMLP